MHYRQLLLENGLRIVVVELPHLHSASLAVCVKVGSRLESAANNGLSHFVEHMLFRGAGPYRTSFDLNFAIEQLGGTLHAETGRDYSLYQISIEPSGLAEGLELLATVFSRPHFTDIERERRLILRELSEDYDERGTETNGHDIVRGLLFGNHPLALRIVGSRDNIRRFTAEQVRAHFSRYYCARNMIVCVAGPVSASEVEHRAAVFAGLPPGEEAQPVPFASSQRHARYQAVVQPGSQATVELLIRGIGELDSDFAALIALLRVLDDGMSTRLHYRISDQEGLAYSVAANLEPLHDVTLLELTATTSPAKIPQLVEQILALLREFRDRQVSEAELGKAKRRYLLDLAATQDDASATAAWVGGTALYYPPPSHEERVRQMEKVEQRDILRVARRIFVPGRLAVVVIGSLTRSCQRDVRSAIRHWIDVASL